MRLRLVFLMIAALLFSCSRSDKSIAVDSELLKMESGFLERYAYNSSQAIDFLAATNKWIGENNMLDLKSKLDSITPLLGNFEGFELIAFRGVGENYVLRSYLAKYDRQPLRFNLIFYRPKSKWQLQNIEFDFLIDDELKEAARAYRLDRNILYEDHE
jgi:hypothetical protein